MKTDNIFDMAENENTVDDSTVIENTGVSTERVLELVKNEIGEKKVLPFGKKRKTAIKITALIAAVLTVSVITASALDGFNAAFGSLFAGDSPDGLYSGGNVEIESEATNVEFLGIAGDDYIAAAALRLTKTDGTPYVDDIANTWIAPASTNDEAEREYISSAFPDTIRYTTPKWFALKYPDRVNAGGVRQDVLGTFGLYFEDASTISAYIYTSSEIGELRGETMTASVNDLSAYTAKEIVYDYSEHIEENMEEGLKTNKDFRAALSKALNEFGTGEKDGLLIVIDPESNDIVLAHETPLDVSFSLSVKMNYKNSTKKLELENMENAFDKWSAGASGDMTVTPFNATLSVELAEPMNIKYEESVITGVAAFADYLNETSTEPETLIFTFEDGTAVTAYDQGWAEDAPLNSTEFSVIYQFFADNGDGSRLHPVAVDPSKIVSIEADGAVIYTAE